MSKNLTKDYDTLDATERAALFIMACDRDDEVEQARLSRTAPGLQTYSMHHMKHVNGLCMLALNYRCQQLETVFMYLFLEEWIAAKGDDQHEYLWARLITSWSYTQELQAFEAFCENQGLKQQALTAGGNPDMLDLADKLMAFAAPSTEELIAIAKKNGFTCPDPLNTAECRIKQYEETYAQLVGLTA